MNQKLEETEKAVKDKAAAIESLKSQNQSLGQRLDALEKLFNRAQRADRNGK